MGENHSTVPSVMEVLRFSELKEHERTHTGDTGEKPFKWCKCEEVFSLLTRNFRW